MFIKKRLLSLIMAFSLFALFLPADVSAYTGGTCIYLDPSWTYANFSVLHGGCAVYYASPVGGKGKVVAVNAGHGTIGGTKYKTYCHPDMTPKVTGGSTAKGAVKATAVAGGMSFKDGMSEAAITLRLAQIFKDRLLNAGYDVLMLRDGADVNLDNVARTVISNNVADCHISLHFDGDGLKYDKGCFYISTPEGIKNMAPVSTVWPMHELLGTSLIGGLRTAGLKINGAGSMAIDLTQTSYSTIPSVDIELGNQCSDHSEAALTRMADGLLIGVNTFFGF
ncbi:MAG: N-acetylmuramoyl-L-alanine amidase [Lachnospiraceae bacterium]|nr:N-acetylmuramoyl-L-alanine amidase [Lachnospiraceae bacterium]